MLGLAPESFDEVVANPPFFDMARVRLPREERRARAMALAEGDLDRWLRFLTTMAKPGGRLTLIHRAEGLGALLSALQGRFGKLSVFPVFSRVGLPAHRILVSGIKGSRGGVELRRGLVVHADDGTITAAAESVLRHGARLDWEAA
jgi:tRNA1(Val) A37 N6-methylase TrmN6